MKYFKFSSIFTVRNSSCGKVMFSQACQEFCPRGVGGGVSVCLIACRDTHPPGHTYPPTPDRHPLCRHRHTHTLNTHTHTPWTDRQTHTHTSPRQTPHPTGQTLPPPPTREGHRSGWYASYWNAFLLDPWSLLIYLFSSIAFSLLNC